MSNTLKELGFRFIFIFLFIFTIGYFIELLELNAVRASAIAFSITLVDFIVYIFKKIKKQDIRR